MSRETGIGINPGRLRRQVKIETYTPTWDHGSEVRTYSTLATVGAEIVALSGRELVDAQAIVGEVQYRVTMRYRPALKSNMRLVYGARVFEVLAVLHDEQRHTLTEALAKEVNPA